VHVHAADPPDPRHLILGDDQVPQLFLDFDRFCRRDVSPVL
jgi:hypothetical protein